MCDIMGMMGKVKEMQFKMEKVQVEIVVMDIEGQVGGGMVMVYFDGKGVMILIKIDLFMFKEDDVEIFEDLIVVVYKVVKDKGEVQVQVKFVELMVGMLLLLGMKFLF